MICTSVGIISKIIINDMKHLILCMSIMLGSFIVKGQSFSSNEWTLFDVTTVIKGSLRDGECYLGEPNNYPPKTIIAIKKTAVMLVSKDNTFGCSIVNTTYDSGGITYETRKDLSGDLILVKKTNQNGVQMIYFINVTRQIVDVYLVKQR